MHINIQQLSTASTYPECSGSFLTEASICCRSCEGLVKIEVVVLITCKERTTPKKNKFSSKLEKVLEISSNMQCDSETLLNRFFHTIECLFSILIKQRGLLVGSVAERVKAPFLWRPCDQDSVN